MAPVMVPVGPLTAWSLVHVSFSSVGAFAVLLLIVMVSV
jgi:hypothetical protein